MFKQISIVNELIYFFKNIFLLLELNRTLNISYNKINNKSNFFFNESN